MFRTERDKAPATEKWPKSQGKNNHSIVFIDLWSSTNKVLAWSVGLLARLLLWLTEKMLSIGNNDICSQCETAVANLCGAEILHSFTVEFNP